MTCTGFKHQYEGKNVLVTGHTGFKGSWLFRWLQLLGARVEGFSLEPPTQPNHFDLLPGRREFEIGDVRNLEQLQAKMAEFKPEIVFHLAAQPIVRYAYHHPVDTFETNVIGTVNLLEACRSLPELKGAIIITSDKCYEDRRIHRGYREDDPMGGDDPYSCSKGCAELVTASYRKSFFSKSPENTFHPQIASARAGNVIGGGDWGADRLIPDVIRAITNDDSITLRNPDAVRPWQHVLDALAGYLLMGQHMLENRPVDSAWNFGPANDSHLTVLELVEMTLRQMGVKLEILIERRRLKESAHLSLDSQKARKKLGWNPIWDAQDSVRQTISWYREYNDQSRIKTDEQIMSYMERAR